MTRAFLAFVVLLFTIPLFGQTKEKSFTVKFISEKPTIDGLLDEAIWKTAESANNFQQYFPSDSGLAKQKTDIKMVYDNTTLFIGITVQSTGDEWVIPSLKRDFRAGSSDNISLLFDTFNDGTNAFLFGMNPYGVRREALISGGGQDLNGFTTSWDVKWKGEAKLGDKAYTAELAIPLTSFKFKDGETKWRFQSYNFDQQINERSVWYKVPQNQLIFSLAFMGDMVFEKPLGKSRTPLALIPYINGISERDFVTNEGANRVKVGGDAKIAVGNGMNLDITVNPDFSNVEVDDIFTNLTRFEVNLPERRQFFVDNGDLFGNFGGGRDANPFFSRRIGIARDTTGNSIENRILGGVRLSGKLNENWRLGFLNIQTDDDIDNEIASNNNMMLAIQKKVFARSNISAFFINRQSFGNEDFVTPEEKFNRVAGVDFNFASANNRWLGKTYLHKSFDPNDTQGNYSFGINAGQNSKYLNAFMDWVYVDEDFNSDLGFILRKDIVKGVSLVEALFWPKSETINNFGFSFFPKATWRPNLDFQKTDHEVEINSFLRFKNQSEFGFGFINSFTFLTAEDDNFVPSRVSGGLPLPNLQGYHYNNVNFRFQSNRALVFSYGGQSTIGRFFNGDRFSFQGQFALRIQPKAIVSLQLNYDKIALPDPFPSANLWLVSPRFEFTFNKSVFWTTTVQYSNQRDNLGINSRLQWRFAPLSDLFIVYNDNYFVNRFSTRFRSINLKLTYWLNI